MENLSLNIQFESWQKGVRESFIKGGFTWRITVEIPDIKSTDRESEIQPKPVTSPMYAAHRLIEAGAYKEASDILERLIKEDPSQADAAEWLGKTRNWLQLKKEAAEKIAAKEYETAIERLNSLTLVIPAGAGKEEVMRDLDELKLKWSKEIEILRSEADKTRDLKKKNLILKQLREISPIGEEAEISNEIEDNNRRIEKIKEHKRRSRALVSIILIGSASLAAITLVFLLTILPGIKCRHYYKLIEEKIVNDPPAALKLIDKIKGGCDAAKTIALTEKANYQVRLNQGETLFRDAFALTDKNEFEEALDITEKIKDTWRGLPLPQSLKEKERRLKDMAAHYYLEKANAEPEPGKRYIYYNQALLYARQPGNIQVEIDNYLAGNR
ncbi:MAG: hypothetical protein L0Y73_08550, partial [Candidatus Aminicenantes bacterium]|nr:hypothetical protein [Candidatus Aminicenantes bacterium]